MAASAAEVETYRRRCSLLEPFLLEAMQYGTFTYTPASLRYLLSGWAVQIAKSAPADPNATYLTSVRVPHPLHLVGTSLRGMQSTSHALILNPTSAAYADARDTYYTRQQDIEGLTLKSIGTINASGVPFLCGPYGSIVLRAFTHDATWGILHMNNIDSGVNLGVELKDGTTYTMRNDTHMRLPVKPGLFNRFQCGGGTAEYPGTQPVSAGLVYVDLPASWSAITDGVAGSYTFRDDFMGASLDLASKWTRVLDARQSTSSIDIDPVYAWLNFYSSTPFGDNSWGRNGLYSQSATARSNGLHFMCDVHVTVNGEGGQYGGSIVGFSDGAGHLVANYAHGVQFDSNTFGALGNKLIITENGNVRNANAGHFTSNYTYRVRITLDGSGGAAYHIQGGPEYPPIGTADWTELTAAGTSSPTAQLRAGIASSAGRWYVGDCRIW